MDRGNEEEVKMANICDEKTCGCPVSGHQAGCAISGAGSCGCPVSGHKPGCSDSFENAAETWTKDAVEALRQVKLEILREKVRKSMGPQLEKAAEATLQGLG